MARFLQSQNDFPLTVSLGEQSPAWGLSRWDGDGGLRFVPTDDEGFSLREDRQRLLYNGLRRSHRFTILGNSSFEYDIILNREPESNVISLRMEGAEEFNFFRQPDFIAEPFLRGSYAVYRKEKLVGQGTGKLCHIHRPELIDARGRRCWGELEVIGNKLQITIPEAWLGEAKYPVIVDPVVGTDTVGSLEGWNFNTNAPSIFSLTFTNQIAVNKYYLPINASGVCRGYAWSEAGYLETVAGRPVMYSDSSGNPGSKLTSGEGLIDLRSTTYSETGFWKTADFSVEGINGGTPIWFGISSETTWYPRFDLGTTCYAEKWSGTSTPGTYPNIAKTYDFILSMYFTFTANFTRTVTQGVSLAGNTGGKVDFRRSANQTAGVTSALERHGAFGRKLLNTVAVSYAMRRLAALYRSVMESVENFDGMGREAAYNRRNTEIVHTGTSLFRGILYFVRIATQLFVRDYLLGRFLKAKSELTIKSRITREITFESRIS